MAKNSYGGFTFTKKIKANPPSGTKEHKEKNKGDGDGKNKGV